MRVDNVRWLYRRLHYLEREVGSLKWERLALTREQINTCDLPVITKNDHRYRDSRPHEAVETEAISQRILIEILREARRAAARAAGAFKNAKPGSAGKLSNYCGDRGPADEYHPHHHRRSRVRRADDP